MKIVIGRVHADIGKCLINVLGKMLEKVIENCKRNEACMEDRYNMASGEGNLLMMPSTGWFIDRRN